MTRFMFVIFTGPDMYVTFLDGLFVRVAKNSTNWKSRPV